MGENKTAIEIKKEKLKEAYKSGGIRKEKIKRLKESIKRHKQIDKSIKKHKKWLI